MIDANLCSELEQIFTQRAVVVKTNPTHPFHLTQIPKGQLGEFSKIKEELLELEDALQQNCRIMALVELSDMLGAMRHFLSNHFPGFTLDDLLKMNQLSERAIEIHRANKQQHPK